MKTLWAAIFLSLSICSCHSQNCNTLPSYFHSYKEAISKIKSGSFRFTDEANTSRSSWITSAKYYSCDEVTGYFIFTTNRNYEYIHQGVPIFIWRQFKTASSLGSFYDVKIKHKYQLILK